MNESRCRVLVPVASTSPDRIEEMALALCEGYGADLYLVNLRTSSDQTALTLSEEQLEQERVVAGEVLSMLREHDPGVDISGGRRVGHDLESLVVSAASEHDVDLIVLDANAFSDGSRLRRSKVRRIARKATCDVIVVSGPGSLEDARTILVPIADGPHSGLAVEAAVALESARDVWIDVLHIVPPSSSEEDTELADRLLGDALGKFGSERVDDWLLEADNVAETIIEESTHYDLTIMGTPGRNRLKRFLFGSTTDTVISRSPVPVVVAWRNRS